jgi:hypothetical protein
MIRSNLSRACISMLVLFSAECLRAQTVVVNNVFDRNTGAILASSFGPDLNDNWIDSLYAVSKNSGHEFFESDNGNFNNNFENEFLVKRIGGTIANAEYEVSFYIAANNLNNANMQPVEFSDFDSLSIGGAGGTMTWLSTPTPTPSGPWVQWTGKYVPSPADVGSQFAFRMVVDIDSRHSLAIDGPMTVTILSTLPTVPEPATGLLLLVGVIASAGVRRR